MASDPSWDVTPRPDIADLLLRQRYIDHRALGQQEHTVQAMVSARRLGPLPCALILAVCWSMPLAAAESAVADDFTTAPASEDATRRVISQVPLFVGPATLELTGWSGAWTWPEVHFGADRVRAWVTLVSQGASCSVRLRLVEPGEPVRTARFDAIPGEAHAPSAVLEVGYVRGRLRIDSDCRDWSVTLVPLPDPQLAVVIEERYYPVRGESIEELTAQVDQVRGKWAAYSEWHTSWTFSTRRSPDGRACSARDGDTAVEVVMTLPDWRRPSTVEPAVATRWQAFLESLRAHELGHVTIALQGAAAIDERLDAGVSAATCAEAGARAAAAARRIFERYARQNRRYDTETGHGLAQGTGLHEP